MMRNDRRGRVSGWQRVVLIAATVILCGQGTCWADSFVSALYSPGIQRAVESVIGPIFPENGIGSTFRSELGTSLISAQVQGAKLTGSVTGELDLRKRSYLDLNPCEFAMYADLRLWRFGLRTMYSNLDNRSRRLDFAKVDFTGLSLTGSMDVIQFNWLMLGAAADVYFIDPTFRGWAVTVPGTPDTLIRLDLKGERPTTVGAYVRYVPPEILNFPMHFEAYFRRPFKGSQIKSYGCAFVFRPQIYRFDLACRLVAEKYHLKFKNSPLVQVGAVAAQDWEVDMEYDLFGLEVAAFF